METLLAPAAVLPAPLRLRRSWAGRVRTGLRLSIAFLLAATAVGKLLDVGGFAAVVATYRVLPEALSLPAAGAVPIAELVLAAWLFSAWALPAAAAASVLMHGAYAGLAGLTLLRGIPVPNCGCFGVFLSRPLTPATILEDLVLLAASAALIALARD